MSLSCKTISSHDGVKTLYAVNDAYYNEVNKTIDNLENNMDTFAYITTVHGNCFGSSVSANSDFTWIKNGNKYLKNITKPPTQKDFKTRTSNCENSDFFNYYTSMRVDTITTLPTLGYEMTPSSVCTLKVKCKNRTYSMTYEPYSFNTTSDTMHEVYLLIKGFNRIK